MNAGFFHTTNGIFYREYTEDEGRAVLLWIAERAAGYPKLDRFKGGAANTPQHGLDRHPKWQFSKAFRVRRESQFRQDTKRT